MSFSWKLLDNIDRQTKKTENYPAIQKVYSSLWVVWHSLQVQAPRIICRKFRIIRKRISLLIFTKRAAGSLTVEAALAMTVFLLVVTTLLNFFFVFRTQIQVQTALEQTGNQLAALPEEATLLTAALLFQSHLQLSDVDTEMIVGGAEGISLARSTIMGHEPVIDLIAVYHMKLPFFPERTLTFNFVQRSRKHAFGEVKSSDMEETDYVYVTPNGEVFHESMYCTYLRPKTQEVMYSGIPMLRNESGGKYEACRYCCDGTKVSTVWITQWGDNYHVSSYCRGLWHQVKQVKRAEVAERRACSKCGAGEEK